MANNTLKQIAVLLLLLLFFAYQQQLVLAKCTPNCLETCAPAAVGGGIGYSLCLGGCYASNINCVGSKVLEQQQSRNSTEFGSGISDEDAGIVPCPYGSMAKCAPECELLIGPVLCHIEKRTNYKPYLREIDDADKEAEAEERALMFCRSTLNQLCEGLCLGFCAKVPEK